MNSRAHLLLLASAALFTWEALAHGSHAALTALFGLYLGRELAGAHDAAADTDAAIEVLAAQLDRYPDLPATVKDLAEFSARRPEGALDREGKFVARDGVIRLTFGKWAGRDVREVEPGYFRWIAGNVDFGRPQAGSASLSERPRLPNGESWDSEWSVSGGELTWTPR